MKQKDIMYLVLAVIILLVAGYVGYTQLVPQKSQGAKTVTVEKIGQIPGQVDAAGLERISDPAKVVNYNSAVDLSGLNNKAPFGQ